VPISGTGGSTSNPPYTAPHLELARWLRASTPYFDEQKIPGPDANPPYGLYYLESSDKKRHQGRKHATSLAQICCRRGLPCLNRRPSILALDRPQLPAQYTLTRQPGAGCSTLRNGRKNGLMMNGDYGSQPLPRLTQIHPATQTSQTCGWWRWRCARHDFGAQNCLGTMSIPYRHGFMYTVPTAGSLSTSRRAQSPTGRFRAWVQ